jgi:phosphatidylserine/phosphatidylglycerophosphate/cardiolipin synthase-like enzyme
MKSTVVVYANSDDALLLWSADVLDDRLEGFSVQRKLRRGGGPEEISWIENYSPPGVKSYQNGDHYTSDQRPFRTFTWTDHTVGSGDKVRYRVVPFLAGTTAPAVSLASAWSKWVTVGPPTNAKYRAFFNRGFVISQFISRYLDENYPKMDRVAALKAFKADITAQLDSKIRIFLSGQVRTALLDLLDEVKQSDDEIYAALFELGDDELIQRLVALKKRAHVVLANGSIEVKKDPKTKKALETSAEARKRDENSAARKKLRDAGADVELKHRFVSPGALAHNKFLVVTDKDGKPKRAWTGSTNWTTTGLCTQLNNALLVEDAKVAAAYLDQWHLLRNAGSGHPKSLQASNGTPIAVGIDKPAKVRASIHSTRAPDKVDLTDLGDIVRTAKEGVLFLMFIPGATGVLADVRALAKAKPKLLVRGVVSDLPKGRQDETTGATTTVKVTVVGSGSPSIDGTQTLDVIQPEGRTHPTARWAAETARSQFLKGIGYAIIHSKILVVDPFGADPTVVTGSHNFSNSASQSNDENFIVVRGEKALAEAYAVNVQSAWRHYAYRAGNAHPALLGIDYLRALLTDQRREESFWHLTS